MKLMKENEDLRVEIIKIKSEAFQKYETLKKNNEEFLQNYEEKNAMQIRLLKEKQETEVVDLKNYLEIM